MTELNKQTPDPQLRQTAVKCRFFAQYWEQKVLHFQHDVHFSYIINPPNMFGNEFNHQLDNAFLELKPLSKITDEDALTAIRIVKVYIRKDGAYVTEHVPIENIKKSFLYVPIWRLDLADFLRSKGYALPFMEHSVDDLVSLGWVRLS